MYAPIWASTSATFLRLCRPPGVRISSGNSWNAACKSVPSRLGMNLAISPPCIRTDRHKHPHPNFDSCVAFVVDRPCWYFRACWARNHVDSVSQITNAVTKNHTRASTVPHNNNGTTHNTWTRSWRRGLGRRMSRECASAQCGLRIKTTISIHDNYLGLQDAEFVWLV